MRQILIAGGLALAVAILLTPVLIRLFTRQGFGQEIRVEGPQSHQTKRGTPTMGGIAIVAAMWVGYIGAHLAGIGTDGQGPTASGLLVLFLATGLAIVGFLDDFIKLRRARNLGLNKTSKILGQFVVAIIFGYFALQFENENGLAPASTAISYVRDVDFITFGTVTFIIFCWFIITAWSNAVNFTDGLDGLVAGSMAMVLGGYVLITFWQYRNACSGGPRGPSVGCYDVRDPLDLALVAVAGGGACLGFLWWNAAPAKIFMGDTGSLALGGMVAGLSIMSRTELLMIIIGALYVAEMVSVVTQIAVFRSTGRRVFRMAPFHHHFELGGWAETTVIIRFWLLTAIACGLGLSLFYSEFLGAS